MKLESDPIRGVPATGSPVFVARIPMRWGDMDSLGHLNNAMYFRYAEQARIDWLESLFGDPRPQGQGMVVVSTRCDFLKPLTYPGLVEVRLALGSPGRSSFVIGFEMRKANQDTLYAEGYAKMVWVDLSTGRAVALHDRIVELARNP